MREKILNTFGKFPLKSKISLQFGEKIDRETHYLQKTTYSTEEKETIESLLLIPKNIIKKAPAIVALHQHNGEYHLGKSEPSGLGGEPQYFYGLELCNMGYVVICFDFLCFESRRPEKYIKSRLFEEGNNYERSEFSKYLLNGSTLGAKYLSDSQCAVDVLCALDFVDENKIGVIGHSLGGQEAMRLAFYDRRIKVGVSSCGFGEMQTIVHNQINHNWSAYLPGLLQFGDVSDMVSEIAPTPFFFSAGLSDSLFPIDGIMKIKRQATKKYVFAGVAENLQAEIFNGPHSFPPKIKEKAYRFINKHLT